MIRAALLALALLLPSLSFASGGGVFNGGSGSSFTGGTVANQTVFQGALVASNTFAINGAGTGIDSGILMTSDGVILSTNAGLTGAYALQSVGQISTFYWYPAKRALRIGRTSNSTYWSDANIGDYSFAYGNNQRLVGSYSTIAGGDSNVIDGTAYNFIGGGNGNNAGSNYTTIGGGATNLAGADYAAVLGGNDQDAKAAYSVAVGGQHNYVWNGADYSTILGGLSNQVCKSGALAPGCAAYATIGGGTGNLAFGEYSTIPGGANNLAAGDGALAAGTNAKSGAKGAFTFADNLNTPLTNNTSNQFLLAFSSGMRLSVGDQRKATHTWEADGNYRAPYGVLASSANIAGAVDCATCTLNVNGGGVFTTLVQKVAKGCTTGLQTDADGKISSCVASSALLKTGIASLPPAAGSVDRLRPVSYRWRDAKARDGLLHHGFIADEVERVYPTAVVSAGPPGVKGIDTNALLAELTLEIQALRRRVAELEKAK